MNVTAVTPFTAGKAHNFDAGQLRQGLSQTAAIATTPDDFANSFARVYDQATIALPAGILLPRQAMNMTQRVETLVTRVPLAPFICVIVLDLLYVIGGIMLTISAILAIRLGEGTRDAQARLSTAAVVAECFEDSTLGNDAVDVKELYAERRGIPTNRIALGKRTHGGRQYGQIKPETKV